MAKNSKRNYRKEYDNYQGQQEQIDRRNNRNKARRRLKNAGVDVSKGDVHHKNGDPTDNSRSNLQVKSKSSNRSFARNKNAGKKRGKTQKANKGGVVKSYNSGGQVTID